jgi:phosphopentomutase
LVVPRAFLFVLDSFGVGGARDAARFGDAGADTYGHIRRPAMRGDGDRPGLSSGRSICPTCMALGLDNASRWRMTAKPTDDATTGFFGAADETSTGKDTPSGHWEIAGLPVDLRLGLFPETVPAFPEQLTEALIEEAGLPGILGNCHASGTEIIERSGEEHIATGKPICYTSSDSVFRSPRMRAFRPRTALRAVRDRAHVSSTNLRIGRVIARPFVGSRAVRAFARTPNRRDYAVPPHEPTLLDRLGRVEAASSASARSPTSSPIAASPTSPRRQTTWPCSMRRWPRWKRPTTAIWSSSISSISIPSRPPARCGGLCRRAGGLRPAAARGSPCLLPATC